VRVKTCSFSVFRTTDIWKEKEKVGRTDKAEGVGIGLRAWSHPGLEQWSLAWVFRENIY
jgi:hypothetical protein